MKRYSKFATAAAGALCAGLLLAACHKESATIPAPQQIYQVKGVVKELEPDGKTVVIQHEAISNYMAAMTMPFEARDPKELRGLKPGDAIAFHLVVTSKEGWIEDVKERPKSAAATPAPAPSPVHFSKAVNELNIGGKLPDYHFTNELGRAVKLSQYRGRVLAFTFFFTSCPYPNFCPRMTLNFEDVAAQLKKSAALKGRWQLLSISFDPKNDTPARLRGYAENAHYDPVRWSFLTGDLEQISELADQFGEVFSTQGPSISHNLRTVVIDPQGRVRKILVGNNWTANELAHEMIKAAKASK